MKPSYQYIGKAYPIQDAELKATGGQKYVGDMKIPGMLHAKVVFSEIAHGRIISINTEKAKDLPGVVAVFTHENTPEDLYNNYAFFVDQAVPKDERLLNDKVRFVGDRVAAVVAETGEIAEEAAGLIEIEYEELMPLINMSQALEDRDNEIHPGGNLLKQSELNFGDAESAINAAELTFHDRIRTQKVHHAAMETHMCVADYDRAGYLTIWTPCQSVFGVRALIADLLKLSYNKVRVVKTITGGSFGAKQQAILEPLTAYMAMTVKRPVRLCYNRRETILSTVTRTAADISIETGVARDGSILGCSINAMTDAGAYVENTNDLSIAMGKKAFRVYRIPNLNYKVKSVLTNTPVSGGCRGWGGPQICTAIEVHFDRISKSLGMDPADFRLKNLVYPYDMENVTKITLGNARIRECLTEGIKAFNWYERKREAKGQGRYRKGVGLACAGHVNGFYGKIQDLSVMTLKMNEDGSFILNTGTHEQGCGTLISLAQITAEVLEVDPARITVLEADTERSPYDVGTFSSRVTYVAGKCALKAAEKLLERILEQAAAILNTSKAYLVHQDGFVWMLSNEGKKLSYRDIGVIAQVKHQQELIVTENYNNVSNPGAYGAHFAEVTVDTYTGMVKVTDYLAVHDVGQVINAGAIEGQVAGSVQMGIGYALCEEIRLDKKGRPTNSSFAKYTLVNAPDMPEVKCIFLEYGGDDGPFGAKSLGEVAVIPVAAAVVNAVNDALGMTLCSLPLTPEKIIEALYESEEEGLMEVKP
ncbi:MAG TPA: molybdopterin cofactor-binding domain-containing protein [Clostridia bacterium]|nr:molybdopterin cofactor-binding domain-containing protein [Clostridia bacterium]